MTRSRVVVSSAKRVLIVLSSEAQHSIAGCYHCRATSKQTLSMETFQLYHSQSPVGDSSVIDSTFIEPILIVPEKTSNARFADKFIAAI